MAQGFTINTIISGTSSSAIQSASTVGTSTAIWSAITNNLLQLKSLSAGTNITLTEFNGNIAINSTASGGGGATVNDGTNTFTAGTSSFQSVNVTGLSINNITVSGSSVFNTLSATTLSGGTIYSGSTDLSNLFATQTTTTSLQNQLNTKVNRSGDTMTGQLTTTILSATTLSGGTIYSYGGRVAKTLNISTDTTLNLDDYIVLVDTNAGQWRVTLPASPENGQMYYIKDETYNAANNKIDINGNGNSIENGFSQITTNGGVIKIIFNSNTSTWLILSYTDNI